MKKILFILSVVLLVGCKKDSADSILGAWEYLGREINGEIETTSSSGAVSTYYANGTFDIRDKNGNLHTGATYEIHGNEITLRDPTGIEGVKTFNIDGDVMRMSADPDYIEYYERR